MISVLRRLRQVDLHVFKTSLFCIVSSRTVKNSKTKNFTGLQIGGR